jgi:hypothetical protein
LIAKLAFVLRAMLSPPFGDYVLATTYGRRKNAAPMALHPKSEVLPASHAFAAYFVIAILKIMWAAKAWHPSTNAPFYHPIKSRYPVEHPPSPGYKE